MADGTRNGALILGLILILAGTVFFLRNWYPAFSPWSLLLRYWPVILIVIGVRKLYRYFTWKEIPEIPDTQGKE